MGVRTTECLCRFAHLVTPNYTGVRHVLPLALVLLLVASEAHAAGPVGPFEPSAPMGTADSDPGKCTQQKGLVYLSTYLSGYQLNEQGFDAPMGAVYYQGPKLTKSTTVPIRGEYCSSNNVAGGIYPMATGIIAWGDDSNEPMTTIYYDVKKMTSKSEFIGCGCRIKVYIKAKPTYATIATTSSTVSNLNDVTIDGTCSSECPLKVYLTQNWCSSPTNSDWCSRGTFGTNAFVYFEGVDATSDAASIGEDAFADSTFTGPSSAPAGAPAETDATPSAPTSSASKASPLPLLISILGLFGIVGNKRVLFVSVLLASVASAQAQPSWRQTLGGALGQALSSYINTLGRCNAFMSEVMIETAIDGKRLQFYFQPTPVGGSGAKYTGPKLELLDRTYMPYGDYCAGSAPSVIPPDGFGNIVIGDSYSGWASGEASFYYKVYKPDGSPSTCILKLYMNDQSNGLERNPTYSLTKDSDCTDVPTLKINPLKVGCGSRGREGGCQTDPKTSINYYSTGFNVYFDGQATAQAASLGDANFTSAEAPLAATSPSPSDANDTAPSAPSAAFTPFRTGKATTVAIMASLMLRPFY